jgi:hypothetical protein
MKPGDNLPNPATHRLDGNATKRWEQKVRNYAAHLALRAVKRDGVFTLSERYGGKEKIGTYRSVEALRRAIRRQHDRMLEAVEREIELERRGREGQEGAREMSEPTNHRPPAAACGNAF